MSLKKLGRYDLIRVLGKGAMGLVYEGRDPNLDRRVAIKTIKVENLSDREAADYEVRFRTEAHSAGRLQHPNIVSVYDSDRDGDMAFLVMEFIEGQDLKHHLDNGVVYTLEQTLGIMEDLLSALEYAHSQAIVHRDIKPANLLIEPGGRVKLTDFGVARIQDSGDATRSQGTIVGTLKYMSPEQLQGKSIDARADLFGAGVVLYQLLTGRRPFDGDTDFAIIQQIVGHTPAAPSTFNPRLPSAIDAVLARALAKSRDRRFASADQFAAALTAACREASDPTVAPPATPPASGNVSTWTSTLASGESLMNTQPGGLGTGTMSSIVTQEVELVYWKDVKESVELEDLQGFLEKFPSGIYADLARRRLRKLTRPPGEDTDTGSLPGTLTSPRPAASSWYRRGPLAGPPAEPAKGAGALDATEPVRREPLAIITTAPRRRRPPNPLQRPAGTARDPDATRQRDTGRAKVTAAGTPGAASLGSRSQWRVGMVLAGIAGVAVVAGLVLKFLPSSAPGAGQVAYASQPAAAQGAEATPVVPAASSVPAVMPVPVSPAVTVASAPVKVAALGPDARAAAAGTPPPAPKRASTDPERSARQVPVRASNTAAVNPAYPAQPPAAPAPVTPPPERVATAAVTSNPRTACEDRMLLAFQLCMVEHCARPAYARHPVCLERRAMDQRRREAEQLVR